MKRRKTIRYILGVLIYVIVIIYFTIKFISNLIFRGYKSIKTGN